MHSDECSISDHSHAEVDASDEEVTLESLLSKIGLQDHVNFFQQEQIDVDSLVRVSFSRLVFNSNMFALKYKKVLMLTTYLVWLMGYLVIFNKTYLAGSFFITFFIGNYVSVLITYRWMTIC